MQSLSHPSRVRELKPSRRKEEDAPHRSHPSRVRELKRDLALRILRLSYSRTPPGCVN